MFGNKKEAPSKAKSTPSSINSGNSFNALVAGTSIEGSINSTSDIRIDGTLKGSLHCDAKVIIGPTGKIEGDVTCEYAMIEGKFDGTLKTKELLNIRENADVRGEIRYGKLIVQPGAILIGDVRMNGSAPAKVKESKQETANAKSDVRKIAGKAQLQGQTVN